MNIFSYQGPTITGPDGQQFQWDGMRYVRVPSGPPIMGPEGMLMANPLASSGPPQAPPPQTPTLQEMAGPNSPNPAIREWQEYKQAKRPGYYPMGVRAIKEYNSPAEDPTTIHNHPLGWHRNAPLMPPPPPQITVQEMAGLRQPDPNRVMPTDMPLPQPAPPSPTMPQGLNMGGGSFDQMRPMAPGQSEEDYARYVDAVNEGRKETLAKTLAALLPLNETPEMGEEEAGPVPKIGSLEAMRAHNAALADEPPGDNLGYLMKGLRGLDPRTRQQVVAENPEVQAALHDLIMEARKADEESLHDLYASKPAREITDVNVYARGKYKTKEGQRAAETAAMRNSDAWNEAIERNRAALTDPDVDPVAMRTTGHEEKTLRLGDPETHEKWRKKREAELASRRNMVTARAQGFDPRQFAAFDRVQRGASTPGDYGSLGLDPKFHPTSMRVSGISAALQALAGAQNIDPNIVKSLVSELNSAARGEVPVDKTPVMQKIVSNCGTEGQKLLELDRQGNVAEAMEIATRYGQGDLYKAYREQQEANKPEEEYGLGDLLWDIPGILGSASALRGHGKQPGYGPRKESFLPPAALKSLGGAWK